MLIKLLVAYVHLWFYAIFGCIGCNTFIAVDASKQSLSSVKMASP